MTKVLLVRHGEPRYDEVEKKGFFGLGHDFGRLTETGQQQAIERASDERFKDAQLILSSPYTRALQTAAIISRITNISLAVETDLHEWLLDETQTYQVDDWGAHWHEYSTSKGVKTPESKYPWESFQSMKNRFEAVLNRYKQYDKIIVVCHEFVLTTQTFFGEKVEFCGVREITI